MLEKLIGAWAVILGIMVIAGQITAAEAMVTFVEGIQAMVTVMVVLIGVMVMA